MESTTPILRRYKWQDLTDPERDAVSDALKVAATRAAIGVGVVLTAAAAFSNARRGQPPLPRSVRYGSLTFFTLAGGYAGFLSAGPLYVKRILSVPNSKLAEDLRIVAGDWQARLPITPDLEATEPQDPLPDPRLPDKESPSDSPHRIESISITSAEQRTQGLTRKTWTYWLGLTKS